MYQHYWGLQTTPFDDTPEARFYYPSAEHQAALFKLRYAIENRRALAVLSGPAGVGKTLLIRCLSQQLEQQYSPLVHLVFPQMPADQLVTFLANRLTGTSVAGDICRSVQLMETFLEANASAGRHAVVVIDEAHVLAEVGALETIRLLTNLSAGDRTAMTVILCGLPRLLSALERFAELEQRMAVKCNVPRLSEEETACYVQHRLDVAGAERAVFDNSAIKALHDLAKGAPRKINRLAELSLLVGFAEEQPILSAGHIEAVAEELAAPA